MKRFGMIALAGVLVIAMAMPAMALENVFGGYWRTRAYSNQNFDGEDGSDMGNYTVVDTRSRLYYTAVLNDNLKFVNKFEMDAVWGDDKYGDIGADGVAVEVKNTYADFNLGPISAQIGAHGYTIARGFVFDDDASGATISYSVEGISVPFVWIKAYEGGEGMNTADVDAYGILPTFTAGPASINFFALYITSDKYTGWKGADVPEDVDIMYGGLNLDVNFDPASIWFTGIYETGTLDTADTSQDISAYLAALGGTVGIIDGADVHGQVVYASGQDSTSKDAEAFFVPGGQSYYWSEIMGYGTFDNSVSNGSPADQISNIMFANLGSTVKLGDGLSASLDVWFAQLVEGVAIVDPTTGISSEEDELGIEIDVKVSYQLIEGLKLDLIGAYLVAGDATTMKSKDDANPFEIGSQLSLSF